MQETINEAIAYVKQLFHGNGGGHDVCHTFRVYRNALVIAEQEPEADRNVVSLAALLHDADDHKLFQTENNENARRFLAEHSVPQEMTEKIIAAINSVSFSQNKGRRPETIEGMIVQDADRLDAMGAVGIARTFAYGGERGRSIEDSVAHFHEKLLLLKDQLNTNAAKELAEERHAFMLEFLRHYEAEIAL